MIIIVIWLICIPLSYLVFRKFMEPPWTKRDRYLAIVTSVLGPIALVIAVASAFLNLLLANCDEESPW